MIEFRAGDRVVLTRLAKEQGIARRHHDHIGTVIAVTREGALRVQWDGNAAMTTDLLHPDYVVLRRPR